MNGYRKIYVLILCIATVQEVAPTSQRDGKTGLNIQEKIIGIIDKVHSHKNKPDQGVQTTQSTPTYPPNNQYNYQQYPQYQQWNAQSNYQNQGFQGPPQYPVQYPSQINNQNYNHASNYPQSSSNFPQGSSYNPQGSHFNNQAYPSGNGQSFNLGQGQQGQYQGVYQNANQFTTGNFQNQQSSFLNHNQASNQYLGSAASFQGQTSQTQGQGTVGNGQFSQGYLVPNQQGAGGGQGPTCVCQAWTKPQLGHEIFADAPVTEKNDKKQETTA